MWQRSNVEALSCVLETERAVSEGKVLGDEGGAGGKEQADEREQATFYKSLQNLLRVSEDRISFLRRTGRFWRTTTFNLLSEGIDLHGKLAADAELSKRRRESNRHS